MASDYHFKKITDPVHGNIGLSRVEAEVVSSRVFQRLHSVRQLGLAHLVYPGAAYSRFSHSIGACHNASRMLASIQRNSGEHFDVQRVQLYRLVGLLHDVGHYPFSHATEHLVKAYYARNLISPQGTAALGSGNAVSAITEDVPPAYEHEELGGLIIRRDGELGRIFAKYGIDPQEVATVFEGKRPDGLIGVISSDLDCDRLDYLRRTAHHSGAPYGSVDIDFIIDQATIDSTGRFCLLPKAIRAADHLLVSRYYDYMQVPYNKTVAALEWSLTEGLKALLDSGMIDCSGQTIYNSVVQGSWCDFDDQNVFEKFKTKLKAFQGGSTTGDGVLRDHLNGIVQRSPPKMVAAWEEIQPKSDTRTASHMQKLIGLGVANIVQEMGIDPARLHVWNSPLQLSKVGPTEDPTDDRLAEAIYVLPASGGVARVLNHHKETLLHLLSNHRYVGLRLYYLPKVGEDADAIVKRMRSIVSQQVEPTS